MRESRIYNPISQNLIMENMGELIQIKYTPAQRISLNHYKKWGHKQKKNNQSMY